MAGGTRNDSNSTTQVSAHLAPTAHASLHAHVREPVGSNPNPAAMCSAVAVAVSKNDALTDDVDRGVTYSASPNAAVNETHPSNASIAVAMHKDTALTDDVDRGIAYAVSPVAVNSELTRSLCKLIGVVYRDVNGLSGNNSDSIHLYSPECSNDYAGTVVNSPLNVSPALSPFTSLAQPHSASERARPSVHNRQVSQLQGEYPPCAVTRVRDYLQTQSPPW